MFHSRQNLRRRTFYLRRALLQLRYHAAPTGCPTSYSCPALVRNGIRDPLDRRVFAPDGTRASYYLRLGLQKNFVCIRFLPAGPEAPMTTTLQRQPPNGTTAREDLQFLQEKMYFGQDILLTTEYFETRASSGIMSEWAQEHLADYVDWRNRMNFFLVDMVDDILHEIDHLREDRPDGARNSPTQAYFLWKAWTWDMVVPCTFRVRYDVAKVIGAHLCGSFSWNSNNTILKKILEMCELRRRYLPRREVTLAQPASPAEATQFLKSRRQREVALYGQQCAEEANYIWQMVEDGLVEKARYLKVRMRDIAHDFQHVKAMLDEININPFADEEHEEEDDDTE